MILQVLDYFYVRSALNLSHGSFNIDNYVRNIRISGVSEIS